jgi:hypothetical protein
MAGKFVDLKEAAKILGVTPEELVDMRSQGEIFGYRDGASWKFKIEEVERVASERSAAGKSSTGSSILGGGDDEEFDFLTGSGPGSAVSNIHESSDSVLVSEDPAEGSAVARQSTVIGKGPSGRSAEDSDLKLADDESALSGERPRGPSLSGNELAKELAAESEGAAEDEYDLASESISLDSSTSDIKVQPQDGSDVLGDVQLVSAGSGTGVMGDAAAADSMQLDVVGGSDALKIDESALDDDSISLDASEMKQGPGTGSDVTVSPGDSGINLRSPTDSGLSLDEEPLDLGGSGLDSLELPEEEEVITLEDEADADMATQLKADEAFSLSPVEGNVDDDDSGSQVIALEDSAAFDQNAATMLNQGSPLLAEGAFAETQQVPQFDMTGMGMTPGLMVGPGMQAQPTYVVQPPQEAPYSLLNVLSLMGTAAVLAISGMLMWDLMLNLWSAPTGSPVSSGIMDAIVSAAGLNAR